MSGHHPTLLRTGRYGSWCTCECGWRSGTWVGLVGAHLAFGQHLLTTVDSRGRRLPERKS